jgi:hypothetical protein
LCVQGSFMSGLSCCGYRQGFLSLIFLNMASLVHEFWDSNWTAVRPFHGSLHISKLLICSFHLLVTGHSLHWLQV